MISNKAKRQLHTGFLFVILSMNLYFYYLVEKDLTLFGLLQLSDLCLILCVIWGAIVLLRYRSSFQRNKFTYLSLAVLVLVITSSVGALLSYGQPLILGIQAQRYWAVYSLLYFPIFALLDNGVLRKEDIKKVLYISCFFEMAIGFAQFFLAKYGTFVSATVTTRYGYPRIYMSEVLPKIVICFSLSDLLSGKRQFFNIGCVIVSFCFLFFVTQGRMSVISAAGAVFITIILTTRISITKKIGLIIASIASLYFLANTEMITDSVDELLTGTGTLEIRNVGRTFYLETLASKPIFGGGFVNTSFENAVRLSLYSEKIYPVDNGIFGMAFLYGGIGLLWFLLVLIYCFALSDRNIKLRQESSLLAFILLTVISCVTYVPQFFYGNYSQNIIWSLFICYFMFSNKKGGLPNAGDIRCYRHF